MSHSWYSEPGFRPSTPNSKGDAFSCYPIDPQEPQTRHPQAWFHHLVLTPCQLLLFLHALPATQLPPTDKSGDILHLSFLLTPHTLLI